MCIRATADIVSHAEQSLSGRDSPKALKEAQAIIRLSRRWLAGQTSLSYTIKRTHARALTEDSARDSDIWSYYLAAGYLAWMLRNIKERPDQSEHLTQAAQKARLAVTSAADKGPGYGGDWAAEGAWQVEYLELLLGLRTNHCPAGRLRNSLLAH